MVIQSSSLDDRYIVSADGLEVFQLWKLDYWWW